MFNRNDGPPTTTMLTIDLPPELGLRLRQAIRRDGSRSLRAIALEALEVWVERDELTEDETATGDV